MAWRVDNGPDVAADLEAIYDHLFAVHHSLGRSLSEAVDLAEDRVARIYEQRERLARAPGMGARHDDLAPGLRHVTIDRAIYWFTVDEDAQVVRILAVWHGGQDHLARMMRRLTGGEGEAP